MNIQIRKCDCCENRILDIRGNLLHADVPSNEMITVADLPVKDLFALSDQLSEHILAIRKKGFKQF